MGMTREEITVKMGLDASSIANGVGATTAAAGHAGEAAGDSFGTKFEHKIGKKFSKQAFHIFFAGMFGSIEEHWKDLTEWMAEEIYGKLSKALEKTGKELDKRNRELKSVVAERDASKGAVEKAGGDFAYRQLDDGERYQFHDKKRDELRAQVWRLREEQARVGGAGEQDEIIQSKINRLTVEQIENQGKLNEAHDKLLEASKKTREEKEKQVVTEREHRNDLIKSAHAAAVVGHNKYVDAIKAPLEFSIGDLAKDNTGWGRRARESQQNLEWAQWNVRHGNFGLAGEQKRKADDIIAGIKKENPFLQDPLGDLKTEAELQNKSLQTIIKDGLQIKASK